MPNIPVTGTTPRPAGANSSTMSQGKNPTPLKVEIVNSPKMNCPVQPKPVDKTKPGVGKRGKL